MKLPLLLAASLLIAAVPAFSQAPSTAEAPRAAVAPAVIPPMTAVNPDGSITFKLLSFPNAKKVTVSTDASLTEIPLTLGADGVWTATTRPLPPERYGYTFVVDGMKMLDPFNRDTHVNFVDLYSDLLVPGPTPMPWELTNIPHGEISKHLFTTHVGQHFADNQTAYVVYTPPGYDPRKRGGYPVLYLLHGFTDTEDGWVQSGKANLMLDRLLADGKIVPMIVVMPRGYGDFEVITDRVAGKPTPPATSTANIQGFVQTLTTEIIPAVERQYNVAKGRENRAVAGLSMGGQEALTAGLAHPDLFAWVGGMSAGIATRTPYDTQFPNADPRTARLKLLWVACGTDDRLITANRAFVTWAKGKGFAVTPVETPGAHTFVVWRQNLLAFAPLLFR